MGQVCLQVEKLTVGYHGIPLIRDISFSLKKGEILTIIGPNGAGKSTVLRSIAGQLPPLGGTVLLSGEEFLTLRSAERAKRVAFVFTDRVKSEYLTCEEVVASGRYPYTGSFGVLSAHDREVIEEGMELLKVKELRDKEFEKLSDGQRQRVMLARAFCQEPEVLLLDEPTSFLDIRYKLEFLSLLQEMKRKKELTVILSLHELDLADRISDQLLCLKGEYVDHFGTPENTFSGEYLRQLFDIETGWFDDAGGAAELKRPGGTPEIFVIAGAGSGRDVYRRLQREGRAFVTGILPVSDLDYPIAKALAAEVIEAPAYEPVTEEQMKCAFSRMDACREVICARSSFGSLEHRNRRLYDYAVEHGKLRSV